MFLPYNEIVSLCVIIMPPNFNWMNLKKKFAIFFYKIKDLLKPVRATQTKVNHWVFTSAMQIINFETIMMSEMIPKLHGCNYLVDILIGIYTGIIFEKLVSFPYMIHISFTQNKNFDSWFFLCEQYVTTNLFLSIILAK